MGSRLCRAIVACFLVLLPPAGMAAASRDLTAEDALQRLFHDRPINAGWFAPEFLAEVPLAEVEALVADLVRKHGPLRGISGSAPHPTVLLRDADVPAGITVDAEGRILALRLEPAISGTLAEHAAAIAALPGRTALLVVSDGVALASHGATTPLAVGSVAKLAVLRALADAVAADDLSWDQVVAFDPAWRSLPSGILQSWPDGTPLTVATLANLAISLSDNSAADALVFLVGRERVEAITRRNTPFLTTRELFTLKDPANAELRDAWLAGDPAARRSLLTQLAARTAAEPPRPGPEPIPGIEWFFTPREICDLLAASAELPALHINPGPAGVGQWRDVAYKGGSEPGVLALATRLVGTDGVTHCVVAAWSGDRPLAEERLFSAYRGILRALREAGPR